MGTADRRATPTSARPAPPAPAAEGGTLRDGRTLYWWVEATLVVAFYFVYSTIRNLNDDGQGARSSTREQIIRSQLDLGINHEQAIQAGRCRRPLIIGANYFYGSLHFIVTGGVMIYLYRRWTNDYPLWRNTLAHRDGDRAHRVRVLPADAAAAPARRRYGFVDTLAKDPAFWSFNSGAVNKISNQFAAMPSVHCAWALWCACALDPAAEARLGRRCSPRSTRCSQSP